MVAYEAAGWGVGELWLEDGQPVWHELPRPRGDTPVAGHPSNTLLLGAHPLADRLVAYFEGEEVSFTDVALGLDDQTPFQRALTVSLRAVPRGEVVTYGELAALAGRPGAARAAGTFCAQNTLPIFIPCHRVVAAEGLGPYGSLGVDYKRRLLALEGYGAL